MVAARLRERLARLAHVDAHAPTGAAAAPAGPTDRHITAATSALMDYQHTPALTILAAHSASIASDPRLTALADQVSASAVSLIGSAEQARGSAFAGAMMLAAPVIEEDAAARRLKLVLTAMCRGGQAMTEKTFQDQARRAVRAELAQALGKRFAAEGLRGLKLRVDSAAYNKMRRELKAELDVSGADLSAVLRQVMAEDLGWTVIGSQPQGPDELPELVLKGLAVGVRSRVGAR